MLPKRRGRDQSVGIEWKHGARRTGRIANQRGRAPLPEEAGKVLDWAFHLADPAGGLAIEWSHAWTGEDLEEATAAAHLEWTYGRSRRMHRLLWDVGVGRAVVPTRADRRQSRHRTIR